MIQKGTEGFIEAVVGKNVGPDFRYDLMVYIKCDATSKKVDSEFNGQRNDTYFVWNEIGRTIGQFIHCGKT